MNRVLMLDLWQDNRRLRTMIGALRTAVLIENENRALVGVNRAFCDLFQIDASPDDLIGTDCAQTAEFSKHLFTEPDYFMQVTERAMTKRQPISGELFTLIDGRMLECSYTPIFLDDVHQGHFWQYEDVTGQHIIARELEASRDRAWAEARMKSEVLAIMSHEVRTPMNGVIGMAELLLSTALNHEQREYATVIYEESHALLRTLNDVLDFSKIEAGKVELDPVPFSLPDLMGSIVDVARHEARRKGLEFHARLPSEVPMLYGDGGRLRQIIVNLLHNAVKFTKQGTVALDIESSLISDQKVALRIEVRDTGIGIPADKLASLFEPFTQAERSTARKHGGTGLGLAIVKQLVSLLNGRIDVTSAPGQGTTFTVHVTLHRACDEDDRAGNAVSHSL